MSIDDTVRERLEQFYEFDLPDESERPGEPGFGVVIVHELGRVIIYAQSQEAGGACAFTEKLVR